MPKADLTVLIVDDEPHIRHSMSRILISLGYSVRCAEDGNTALARIRQNCPDVLLSDLYMAGCQASSCSLRFAAVSPAFM